MENNVKIISTITIPNYPDRILVSKKRRPRYFKEGKNYPKVPKKYQNDKYYYNTKGILVEKSTGVPVIANPRTVGEPRYWKVNFQSIWNGSLRSQSRAKLTKILKSKLRDYLVGVPRIEHYPVGTRIIIYDLDTDIDCDNLGVIFHKVINDLLQEQGIIPNDSVRYLNDTGRTVFKRVNNVNERRMVIQIFESEE